MNQNQNQNKQTKKKQHETLKTKIVGYDDRYNLLGEKTKLQM